MSRGCERWWGVREGFDVGEGEVEGGVKRWMGEFVEEGGLGSVGVVGGGEG